MFDFKVFDENNNSVMNFWQYDYGVRIVVEKFDEKITEFHFANKNSLESIVVKPLDEDNRYVVAVPDDLLKENSPITIYAYCIKLSTNSGLTIKETTIPVIGKSLPTHNIIETFGKVFLDGNFVVTDDNVGNVTISYSEGNN